MIFVNLPVTDLPRAQAFYEALGFTRNPAFSDDAGSCMVLSEAIYVMILTHANWQGFTRQRGRDRPSTPAPGRRSGRHRLSRPTRFSQLTSTSSRIQRPSRGRGAGSFWGFDLNIARDVSGRSARDRTGRIA